MAQFFQKNVFFVEFLKNFNFEISGIFFSKNGIFSKKNLNLKSCNFVPIVFLAEFKKL